MATLSIRYGCYIGTIDPKTLPIGWSNIDKSRNMRLHPNGRMVTLTGPKKKDPSKNDVYMIRTYQTVDEKFGIYYYETNILDLRNHNLKNVPGYFGFSSSHSLCMMRGDLKFCRLYYGFDGTRLDSNGTYVNYGPPLNINDTIGCGIDFISRSIFFTHNGEYLGVAYKTYSESYYPMIGFDEGHVCVTTNFGDFPFKFDIESYCKEKINSISKIITSYQPKFDIHSNILKHIYNYLIYCGHIESAEELKKSRFLIVSGNEEECTFRKNILSLIRMKRTYQCYDVINQKYPNKLDENPELMLEFLIFQYIDSCYYLNNFTLHNQSSTIKNHKNSIETTKENTELLHDSTELSMLIKLVAENNQNSFNICHDNEINMKDYLLALQQTLNYLKQLKDYFEKNITLLESHNDRVKRLLCLFTYDNFDFFSYPEYLSNNTRENFVQDINQFFLINFSDNKNLQKPTLMMLPKYFKNNISHCNLWKHPNLAPGSYSCFILPTSGS